MLGFLVAIAAGFVTPHLDQPVAGQIAKALEGTITIAPEETRALSFMAALLAAVLIAAALQSGSPFGILLGAVLGYFATRITAKLRAVIAGHDSAA